MALATRCPHCETVFRLDPHLLAPHDGRVRCGHCQEVFDAAHHQFEIAAEEAAPSHMQHASTRDEVAPGALADSIPVSAAPAAAPVPPPSAAASPEARPTASREPAGTPSDVNAHATPAPAAPAPLQSTAPATASESRPVANGTPREPAFTPSGLNGHSPNIATAPIQSEAPPHDAGLDSFGKPHTKSFVAGAASSGDDTHTRTEPLAEGPAEAGAAPLAEPSFQTRTEPSLDASPEAKEAHSDTRAEPFIGPPFSQARKPSVRARTGPFAERAAAAEAKAESPTPARGEGETPAEAGAERFVEAGAHARTEPFVGPAQRTPKAPPRPAVEPEAPPRPATGSWQSDPEPRFAASASGASAFPPGADGEAEPFPVTRETRGPLRSRAFWRVAGIVIAVLLALALIVQLAWWHRETVMVFFPRTQTLYADACEELGCTVAPPRDIDGLQIENSGLRQIDGPHKLELKLSLRNRFDVALAYPALELTLLDDKNNVAIRRVLWPQDYARPGTIFAAGLAARGTQAVVVRLDTGDVVAANYRVQVFYP